MDIEVAGGVGEGLQIASAVEQLVFQSEITKQRGGDRLTLLHHRFGERGGAAQGGGDDVGHPAQITQRGGDQLRAFVRVRRVRRQFFTHGFVAGLRLSSLRDLRLGVGECCSVRSWVMSFWVVVSVIVLLMGVVSGVRGSRKGCAPFEGWRIVFRVSVQAAVRTSRAVVEATRAPLASAISRWTASLEPVRDSP